MHLLPPTGLRAYSSHFRSSQKERRGVSQIAQQANALGAKPNDLSLMPRTERAE